eukprot:Skav211404  [mRNA]  locus=scaffold1528:355111:366364:+ [translate_table: standard]
MATSSSWESDWQPEPWRCHCGRGNAKNTDYCGSCGDHWSATPQDHPWQQQPKSPRQRAQRAQTPPANKHRPPKKPNNQGQPKPKGKGGQGKQNRQGQQGQGKGKSSGKAPAPPPFQFPSKGGTDPPWPPGNWDPQWNAPMPANVAHPNPQQTVVPPLPPVPETDPQMKQLLTHLKQMSDTLPSHVQQLVTEVGSRTDQMDSKLLHNAVARLDRAKKSLATLRLSRLQMYSAWSAFVGDATTKWQGYVRDFAAQDVDIQTQIQHAREQLAQAKDFLRQSKDRVVGAEKSEEISDDEPMLKEDAGKEITESLTQMVTSMTALKSKADHAIAEDMQRASKLPRTGEATELEPPSAPGPGAGDKQQPSTPSMSPFGVRASELSWECGTITEPTPTSFVELRPHLGCRAHVGPVRFSNVIDLAFVADSGYELHSCRIFGDALKHDSTKPWNLYCLADRLGLPSDTGMRLPPVSSPASLSADDDIDFASFMQSSSSGASSSSLTEPVVVYFAREGAQRVPFRWFPAVTRLSSACRALGLPDVDLIDLHPLALPTHGELSSSRSAIAQLRTDLVGSDHVMILIEILSHASATSESLSALPFSSDRIVYIVPKWISRDYVFHRARVHDFCSSGVECILLHNGVTWAANDLTDHSVQHGDVFQIHLPEPDQEHAFVLDAIDSACSFSTPTHSDDDLYEDTESSHGAFEPDPEVFEPSEDRACNTYFWVWFVHHTRWATCSAPRLACIPPNTIDLLQFLGNVWSDRFVRGAPTRVNVVFPQPGFRFSTAAIQGSTPATFESEPMHLILEQGLQGSRSTALVITSRHLTDGVSDQRVAWSLPYYVTGDLILRAVGLGDQCFRLHRCEVRFGGRVLAPAVLDVCPGGALYQIEVVQTPVTDVPAVPDSDVTDLWQTSLAPLPPIVHCRLNEPSLPESLSDSEEEVFEGPELVDGRWDLERQTPFIRALFEAWSRHSAAEQQEEGPVAYIRTFFLSTRRQVQCREYRSVRLLGDYHDWDQDILAVWNDMIIPFEEIQMYIVTPDPPRDAASAGVAAFVILIQDPDPDFTATLLAISGHAAPDGIEYIASFAPMLLQRGHLLALAGLGPMCFRTHPVVTCRVYFADVEFRERAPGIPVPHGSCITFVTARPPEESPVAEVPSTPYHAVNDDTSDDEAIFFQNSISPVVQSPFRVPICAPGEDTSHSSAPLLPTSAAHPPSSASIAVRLPRLSIGEHLAQRRLEHVGSTGTAPEASFRVITYYVSLDLQPFCRHSRTVELVGSHENWLALMHRAWNDVIDPDVRLHFHLVTPRPPCNAASSDIVAHVILQQHPTMDYRAVLVTTLEQGSFSYLALFVPVWVNHQLILDRTGMSLRCAGGRVFCATWFSGIAIRAHPFFQADHGFGFILGIFVRADTGSTLVALDTHWIAELPGNGPVLEVRPAPPTDPDSSGLWQSTVMLHVAAAAPSVAPSSSEQCAHPVSQPTCGADASGAGSVDFVTHAFTAWSSFVFASNRLVEPSAPFRTFFLRSPDQWQSSESRIVYLSADFESWTPTLLDAWADYIHHGTLVTVTFVSESPPDLDPDVAGHFIVTQERPHTERAILCATFAQGPQPSLLASFSPFRLDRRAALGLVGSVDDCLGPAADTLCSVRLGSRDVTDAEEVELDEGALLSFHFLTSVGLHAVIQALEATDGVSFLQKTPTRQTVLLSDQLPEPHMTRIPVDQVLFLRTHLPTVDLGPVGDLASVVRWHPSTLQHSEHTDPVPTSHPVPPVVPWSVDVHTHAALVQKWLVSAQPPKRVSCPRKKHLSESTWNLIQQKRYHKKRVHHLHRELRVHSIRAALAQWRPDSRRKRSGGFCASCFLPLLHRELAFHELQSELIALQVVKAVRADDRSYYHNLAFAQGRVAADEGMQGLWRVIRGLLPRQTKKRSSRTACVGPPASELVDHYCQIEAGEPVAYQQLLKDCHDRQRSAIVDAPLQIALEVLRLRKMILRLLLQEQTIHEVADGHRSILQECEAHGVSLSEAIAAPSVEPASRHRCDLCPKAFSNVQALSCHRWKAHGRVSKERHYMTSTTCGACGKCFWTAVRLQQHLKRSQAVEGGCFAQLQRFMLPVDPATTSGLREIPDHLRDVAYLPALPSYGPVQPWTATAWEVRQADKLQQVDREWASEGFPATLPTAIRTKVAAALSAVTRDWIRDYGGLEPSDHSLAYSWLEVTEDGVDPMCGQWAFLLWGQHGLYDHFDGLADIDAIEYIEHQFLTTASDLPMWRLLCLRDQLQRARAPDPPAAAVPDPAPDLRQVHLLEPLPECFNLQAMFLQPFTSRAVVDLPAQPAIPVWYDDEGAKHIFILHAFSGRRRDGDCHVWLEELGPQVLPDYTVHLIALDTAIDAVQCDLFGRGFSMAMALCLRSLFAAVLAGPPCETWTAARHLHCDKPRAPRPLRSRQRAWGLPFLTTSELRQLRVGSNLMIRSTYLEVVAILRGAGSLMEHPAIPIPEDYASTWRTELQSRIVARLFDGRLLNFGQFRHGAQSVKPTVFRVVMPTVPVVGGLLPSDAGVLASASRQGCNASGNAFETTMIQVIT